MGDIDGARPDERAFARCGESLSLRALPGLPLIGPGDDLAAIVRAGLARAGIALAPSDVLVVTSKIVSRAEGRFVDLATVTAGAEAEALGTRVGKDPRVVELILRESAAVSRVARGVLVVRHRLGFVVANAGIDLSNAAPPGAPAGQGPWALLLPTDPDGAAERLRRALSPSGELGVVISDSFGRPFRHGTVGAAIGSAGVPALSDLRGDPDLHGRRLEQTITALADELAAAAGIVAGQGAEGRAVVHVRGLAFAPVSSGASGLCRAPGEDLYA